MWSMKISLSLVLLSLRVLWVIQGRCALGDMAHVVQILSLILIRGPVYSILCIVVPGLFHSMVNVVASRSDAVDKSGMPFTELPQGRNDYDTLCNSRVPHGLESHKLSPFSPWNIPKTYFTNAFLT